MERCAGAMNGTFMKICKPPVVFGDSYWCYKKFCSLLILGPVDACGMFVNVNAGLEMPVSTPRIHCWKRLKKRSGLPSRSKIINASLCGRVTKSRKDGTSAPWSS